MANRWRLQRCLLTLRALQHASTMNRKPVIGITWNSTQQ